MNRLIDTIEQRHPIEDDRIREAFRQVDRGLFVPENRKPYAYDDVPLPIGEGQTISQPSTVAYMLKLLDIEPGQHVLDIGAGSGWQTALLAHVVGDTGRVYSIERIAKLCAVAQENFHQYPELNKRIYFFCQDATPGLPHVVEQDGPFHRIVAAAAVEEVPKAWRRQLAVGGILVYPRIKAGSLVREVKQSDHDFDVTEYLGFVFVPYVNS